jgi:hypothetical protein
VKETVENPPPKPGLLWAWVGIATGVALMVLPYYFTLGLSDELRAFASVVGMASIAWGIAQFLWHWRERIGRVFGPLTLLAGCLVMYGGLGAKNLLVLIVGGFLAVGGAVLIWRKRIGS